MIRATVVVEEPTHIVKCYSLISKEESIKIIRIKNKLDQNLQNVSINFIQSD